MPIVKIDILKGRSIEVKEKMIAEVSKAISDSLRVDMDKIRVIISEMEEEHYGIAGVSARKIKQEKGEK